MHFAAVLEHAPQPSLLKAELPFDHAKRMFHLRSEVRLSRLDQIINPSLGCLRQGPALAWPHGNAEANTPALHLGALCNSLVTGIRVDHSFLTMQEHSGGGEVMHIGGRGLH